MKNKILKQLPIRRSCSWILVIISILMLLSFSCEDVGVQPPDNTFTLTVDDASCTEVWLRIRLGYGNTNREVTLKRDTLTLFTKTIDAAETVITDTNLTPNHTYAYTASLHNSSLTLSTTARTMDTTSHNFTWQTFTFGDASAGGGVLYDAAIIDENNIWAVGEIKIADTSENGYTTYNAVHWNGNEWELKKITVNFRGSQITPPLEGAFIFSSSDIWFVGSLPIHGDGENWTIYDLRTTVDPNLSLSKAWGNSSDNIYFVGLNGSIAHYQSGQWSKIESGTDLPFSDIYGATNTAGKQEILAVCTRDFPLRKGIYKIEGNTAVEISVSPIQWELYSVWFIPDRHYYVVGDGIYEKIFLSESSWKNEPLDITNYSTTGVRGNGLNDIFVSGAFGEILHFNGVRWKSFIDETGFDGGYGEIAVKNNVVVAVGGEEQLAKILIGKKIMKAIKG